MVAMRSRPCSMKTEKKGRGIAFDLYLAGPSLLIHNLERMAGFHLMYFAFFLFTNKFPLGYMILEKTFLSENSKLIAVVQTTVPF